MIDQIQNTHYTACVSSSCSPRSEGERQPEIHTSGAKDTVRISSEGREQLRGLLKQPSGISAEENLGAEEKKEVEAGKEEDASDTITGQIPGSGLSGDTSPVTRTTTNPAFRGSNINIVI